MSHYFTFESNPLVKKTQNIVTEPKKIIEKFNLKKFNNIKLKHKFVINHINLASKNSKVLIKCFERDGLKCQCCGYDNIYYTFYDVTDGDSKQVEPVIFRDGKKQRITRDHNLLKSLKGSDDVSNITALCCDCNNLRANDFAEYKEFKDYYDLCMEEYGTYIKPSFPNYSHIHYTHNFKYSGCRMSLLPYDELPISYINEIKMKIKSIKKTNLQNIKFNDLFSTSYSLYYLDINKVMKLIVKESLKAKFHIFCEVDELDLNLPMDDQNKVPEYFIMKYRELMRHYLILDSEKNSKVTDTKKIQEIILTCTKEMLQSKTNIK